ncbi:RidA family protein [Pusillimonas caeni]|nr:RidA family protein [Pusillimonas caeni]
MKMIKKQAVPFGDAMGMEVAFCNAISVDMSTVKRQIWLSGQIAFDEQGDIVGKGDIAAQTEQCVKNLQAALEKLDATLNDIVEVTVFVTDMTGLKHVHEVRLKYFDPPYPTSTLVRVSGFVHPDALIEIKAVAVV